MRRGELIWSALLMSLLIGGFAYAIYDTIRTEQTRADDRKVTAALCKLSSIEQRSGFGGGEVHVYDCDGVLVEKRW